MSTPIRQHAPGLPTGSRSLTARQRKFVRAYARDAGRAGAAAAAREAGYRSHRAADRGYRLLREDFILAAIEAQPGGRRALERLAQSTHSGHIRTLVVLILEGAAGLYVVTADRSTRVLTDRSAAAARRYAVAHGDELRPAEAENGPNPDARVDTEG